MANDADQVSSETALSLANNDREAVSPEADMGEDLKQLTLSEKPVEVVAADNVVHYCRYFNRPQGCRNGDRCGFVHERLACRDFNAAGRGCSRGDSCFFAHKGLRPCQHPTGCDQSSPFLFCDSHRIRTHHKATHPI